MLGHRKLNIEDYLSILKRRGWIALITVTVLPIISVAYSYTIPPQFLSQTLVLIETQTVPDTLVKPVIATDLDGRLASMKEQILSRSSLQPIIERYHLYEDKKLSLDDRIDLTRKNIDIKTITSATDHAGLPGFFISFKAGDARTAQLVCSDITTLFTGQNLKLSSDAAEGTTEFLKSQLDEAKRNLDEQDAKLAAFERQYMGRLPGETSPNMNMLTSLNTQLEASTQQLTRMEQDKVMAESMLTQAQGAQPVTVSGSGQTAPVAPQAQQLELQSLQAKRSDLITHYTPDYPDVVALDRQIADLRRQIARNPESTGVPSTSGAPSKYDSPTVVNLKAQIRAEDLGIAAKRKEQAQIQAGVRAYQEKIQSSPMVEQEYKQVTRGHETAQAFYDNLLSKSQDANMSKNLIKRQQGEQFRVQDSANLPEAPFSPKRSVFLAAGIAGGLVIGLLIIAFLDYKDTTLRSERDIWAFTELPTLAIIAYSTEFSEKTPGIFARLFQRKKRPPVLAQANS